MPIKKPKAKLKQQTKTTRVAKSPQIVLKRKSIPKEIQSTGTTKDCVQRRSGGGFQALVRIPLVLLGWSVSVLAQVVSGVFYATGFLFWLLIGSALFLRYVLTPEVMDVINYYLDKVLV